MLRLQTRRLHTYRYADLATVFYPAAVHAVHLHILSVCATSPKHCPPLVRSACAQTYFEGLASAMQHHAAVVDLAEAQAQLPTGAVPPPIGEQGDAALAAADAAQVPAHAEAIWKLKFP